MTVSLDPEAVYYDLITHAQRCATCYPWRDCLFNVERLCSTGRALCLLYANAELNGRLLESAS